MWQGQMLEWDLCISEASLEALLFHPLNLAIGEGAETSSCHEGIKSSAYITTTETSHDAILMTVI
jgi:hypothetical protein